MGDGRTMTRPGGALHPRRGDVADGGLGLGTARFEWDGRNVELRVFLTGRHLWLATEEELRVDGVPVVRTGGFRMTTRGHAALEHRGIHVKVSLVAQVSFRAPLGSLYRVLVDDQLVWEGGVIPGLAWRVPG